MHEQKSKISEDAKANLRFESEKKSTLTAYLLWFFLGVFGIHRFYLGKTKTAIAILLLTIIGWVLVVFGVGFVFLIIVGIWLLIDLFLVMGMVNRHNKDLVDQITR